MKRSFASSLAVHAGLVAGIAVYVATDEAKVRGGAGLSGATRTHFEITVGEISVKPAERPAPSAREGVEIPATKLPADAKNPRPREIDENPNATRSAAPSNGSSSDSAPGREGQGGTGDSASAEVGDGERSNRLGLYLQKLRQKVQSQLGASPYLEFDRRALVSVTIALDGSADAKISQTSGDRELDRRALQAVRRAAPFDPWEKPLAIELPVHFRAK